MLSTYELIRSGYRSLLATRRSYASFSAEHLNLVLKAKAWMDLNNISEQMIFDPMSGYGGTALCCAENKIPSYCIEYNYPQYLWQLLFHHHIRSIVIKTIDFIVSQSKIKESKSDPEPSKNLFTIKGIKILSDLLSQIKGSIVSDKAMRVNLIEEVSLAILLPFVSRLACYSSGDTSSHVKQGGICIYNGYAADFIKYVQALRECLAMAPQYSRKSKIIYDDATIHRQNKYRFNCMITSPPYPNSRDFQSMFKIENQFLDIIVNNSNVRYCCNNIGSVFVKGKNINSPKSAVAKKFLKTASEKASEYSKRAEYDHRTYYGPYFSNYFSLLESAYLNVAKMIIKPFLGYIVVVNNTYRGINVPVGQFIQELWGNIGFTAYLAEENEHFHVGTKNPRAKGMRAKHTEYVIKLEKV